jgi:penicillin-insensitive murein endopeptidase
MHKVMGCFTALSVALVCVAVAKNVAHVPLPPSNPLRTAEQEKQNSKPANVLFAEKELPSLGKAMAIGYYPRGCLLVGVELPVSGLTWQGMRVSRNRN